MKDWWLLKECVGRLINCFDFVVSGGGKCLVLADSMARYVLLDDIDVSPYPGETVKGITSRVRSGEVQVTGYTRILIHLGSNDLSNMFDSRRYSDRRITIFDLMDRYVTLRNSIRMRNQSAVLLFSSILPRVNRWKLFKPFIRGVNFALRKLCAKTHGACIYIPLYDSFVFPKTELPRSALFRDRDGLHLVGGGLDKFESLLRQAFSNGYLLDQVNSGETRVLANLKY